MSLRLGELCAGYGGLGLAVEEVFNAESAWFSEFDAAPSKILAHHWPHVPNYGDMTQIDWAAIEPVDIISGGTPCQDLSAAGRRKGMTEGTRSNLWVQMREAIAIQRPRYVVWENVRGAYSATADSDLEQCPGCMGDATDRGTVLRALGRVLGDLSDLGYDAEWRGLRAADVGAPHARFRVFVLARRRIPNSSSQGLEIGRPQGISRCQDSSPAIVRNSPHVANADDRIQRPGRGDMAKSTPSRKRAATRGDQRLADSGRGDSPANARSATTRQLTQGPPKEEAGTGSSHRSSNHHGERPAINWGPYETAIRRWESRLNRTAPRPTEPTGRDGGERLSPRFTEWMMGLPDGWVTDPAIGITRNEQLKACGNGVVPQQAIAALRDMLAAFGNQERSAA